jgi:hypothetical protein
MKTGPTISPTDLARPLDRLFELAERKCSELESSWDPSRGAPVFTVAGKYTTRGWTEWTQGFQYGCCILAFDATDDRSLLETARTNVVQRMAAHVTHIGVHDHGFNTISTYGNLRRLMREGRIPANEWEMAFTRWRSRPAAPCRRLAGHQCMAGAVLSIRSTVRIPFSSTRCDSPRAGAGASTRPCAHGRNDRQDLAA